MNLKLPVFTKHSVYAEKYFLYQYNDQDFRIVKQKYCRQSGFEEKKKEKQLSYIPQTESEEIERISLSRTKKNIRELCLSNNFQFFVTFTVASEKADRFSLTEVQKLLRKKLKALKRKNSDFAYLIITEKHESGAFHFHGLIKGIDVSNFVRYTEKDFDLSLGNKLPTKLIKAIKRGDIIYHFPFFDQGMGYNTISPIKSYTKCCNYITKYITKDCVKNEAGTVYISSRGLKKADVYEIEKIVPLGRLHIRK